jgi:hypothetical protein
MEQQPPGRRASAPPSTDDSAISFAKSLHGFPFQVRDLRFFFP